MKNFNIQSLGVVMMLALIMMVRTSPVPNKDQVRQLEQIQEEAKNLSKHLPLDIAVAKVSKEHKRCVKHFFCLSEMALKHITNASVASQLSKITRLLHKYNEMIKDVSCNLDRHSQHNLTWFLQDIETCVDYALNDTLNTN